MSGIVGALLLLGGGVLADDAYSNSQQSIRNGAFYPVMWRDLPATRLFPENLGTAGGVPADHAEWERLGISEDTSCAHGLAGKTKALVLAQGCTAVLRATYDDPAGSTVGTVALIVLSGTHPELGPIDDFFERQLDADVPDGAVNPFPVPGSLAAHWSTPIQSGMAGGDGAAGPPYELATATGAADGRVGQILTRYGISNNDDLTPWMNAAQDLLNTYHDYFADLPEEAAQ